MKAFGFIRLRRAKVIVFSISPFFTIRFLFTLKGFSMLILKMPLFDRIRLSRIGTDSTSDRPSTIGTMDGLGIYTISLAEVRLFLTILQQYKAYL